MKSTIRRILREENKKLTPNQVFELILKIKNKLKRDNIKSGYNPIFESLDGFIKFYNLIKNIDKNYKPGFLEEINKIKLRRNGPTIHQLNEIILKLKEISKNFESQGEWHKKDLETWQKARLINKSYIKDFWSEITKNFFKPSKKNMYAYEFYSGKTLVAVYVGLSCKLEKRRKDHEIEWCKIEDKKRTSAVSRFINNNPELRYEFINLESNKTYEGDEAKKREQYWIDEYSKKGIEILNVAPAGSLGGGYQISNNRIIDIAKNYKSINDWRNSENQSHRNALRVAYDRGLMDSLGLERIRKKYTDDELRDIASNYVYYDDWRNSENEAHRRAWDVAIRRKELYKSLGLKHKYKLHTNDDQEEIIQESILKILNEENKIPNHIKRRFKIEDINKLIMNTINLAEIRAIYIIHSYLNKLGMHGGIDLISIWVDRNFSNFDYKIHSLLDMNRGYHTQIYAISEYIVNNNFWRNLNEDLIKRIKIGMQDVIEDEIREFLMNKSEFGNGTFLNRSNDEYHETLYKFEKPLINYFKNILSI